MLELKIEPVELTMENVGLMPEMEIYNKSNRVYISSRWYDSDISFKKLIFSFYKLLFAYTK